MVWVYILCYGIRHSETERKLVVVNEWTFRV